MALSTTRPSFIVSTDLDGTLLDHHTYSWQAATNAIETLQKNNIPIIFNTSKTLQEACNLQKEINIEGPLIIENGSALALPKALAQTWEITTEDQTTQLDDFVIINFGRTRADILHFIDQQKLSLGNILEGYNDWSLEEISERTGLSLEDAKCSSDKKYSEPFVWLSDDNTLKAFYENAQAANLKILKGGRFYHLQGNTDKAKPLLWLQKQLSAQSAKQDNTHEISLICLGDNKNDIDMLNVADFPVCVKSPTSPYPEITTTNKTIYTKSYGPEGWHEAIMEILSNQM